MDLIKHKYIFLGISGTLVAASLVSLLIFGLTPGTDLAGGARWQFVFSGTAPSIEAVRGALGTDAKIADEENGAFTARLPAIGEGERAAYRAKLAALGAFEERSFSSIGPTVGAELKGKAIRAILFVLLSISLYIAWAFRKVSAPLPGGQAWVRSWKYGVVTLVTLFHDVAIPAGLLAVFGFTKGIEIDTNFIVALLVVMGFSVHDTIVVFDRIRENLLKAGGKGSFADVVNRSVRETFARSVNTSLTLVLVLAALLVVGPSSLFYFILVILVGTVVGTYSSIFVASPLLFLWAKGR